MRHLARPGAGAHCGSWNSKLVTADGAVSTYRLSGFDDLNNVGRLRVRTTEAGDGTCTPTYGST